MITLEYIKRKTLRQHINTSIVTAKVDFIVQQELRKHVNQIVCWNLWWEIRHPIVEKSQMGISPDIFQTIIPFSMLSGK